MNPESSSLLAAFDSQPRTRLIFGENSIDRVGKLARELNARRVLVVTDPGIVTAGHALRVEHALQAAGLGVVLYDRVRENLANMGRAPLSEIINVSINQTLGRTILTTITTLIVVVSLYLKGGEVLNTFALTLIIGFIAGTYSTIFIASPLVLAWEKKKN